MHALWLSLVFLGMGIAVGYLAQRSRMCFVAGLRDWILVRDTELLLGLFSFLATVWLLTSVLGAAGMIRQGVPEYPTAAVPPAQDRERPVLQNILHVQVLGPGEAPAARGLFGRIVNRFFFASLAGGFLVGVMSVIAGGCVLRQHVLCAQGNRNALFYLAGFYGAVVVYYLALSRFFAWVYG